MRIHHGRLVNGASVSVSGRFDGEKLDGNIAGVHGGQLGGESLRGMA